MQPAEQQAQLAKDRDAANAKLATSESEIPAVQQNVELLARYQALAAKLSAKGLLGPSYAAAAARRVAEQVPGGDDAQDLQALSSMGTQLITAARQGTGIQRVTNFDMRLFEEAGLEPDKDIRATQAIGAAMQAKFRRATDFAEFQRDYVDTNGSMNGMLPAWNAYEANNPLIVSDKNGQPTLNPAAQDRRAWFAAHTDPQTATLNMFQSLPPAAKYTGYKATGSDGKVYVSDGTKWNPVQ